MANGSQELNYWQEPDGKQEPGVEQKLDGWLELYGRQESDVKQVPGFL